MVVSTTYSPSASTSDQTLSITQNGVEANDSTEAKSCTDDVALKLLPKGKYTLVCIDIDTTGRRLIDEIVQLAAFTPDERFSQYIMPYMNLNPAARKRHQVRVISIGFYRMLKSTQNFKIIKSKSEIAALKDFLNWLEAVRAKDSNSEGVILICYEERKFIPYMILEALKKYSLLDRFLNTVKSFVNGIHLTKTNVDQIIEDLPLRKIAKHLKNILNISGTEYINHVLVTPKTALDPRPTSLTDHERKKIQKNMREVFDGNAIVRARLTYEVTYHLSNKNAIDPLASPNITNKVLAALQPHIRPIECDISELQAQKENLERQNSFRPVLLNYFKTTLYHRVRAVKFRIILAEHSYDLQTLNTVWSKKKLDGLAEVLQEIVELKSEDKTELANLFDSYFDPAKTTIKPIVNGKNRSRNRRVRNIVKNNDDSKTHLNGHEQGAGGDNRQGGNNATNLPDSTTKSPKTQRGKRNSRFNNTKNVLKPQTPNETNNTNTALVTPTASN